MAHYVAGISLEYSLFYKQHQDNNESTSESKNCINTFIKHL